MAKIENGTKSLGKRELLRLVEGVVSELVLMGGSFLDTKRLKKALNLELDTYKGGKEPVTIEEVDKTALCLFMRNKIVPDVLGGQGYIIAHNCERACVSAEEYAIRSARGYGRGCGISLLYDRDEAKHKLSVLDSQAKAFVDKVSDNYAKNYNDIREVFVEFAGTKTK